MEARAGEDFRLCLHILDFGLIEAKAACFKAAVKRSSMTTRSPGFAERLEAGGQIHQRASKPQI